MDSSEFVSRFLHSWSSSFCTFQKRRGRIVFAGTGPRRDGTQCHDFCEGFWHPPILCAYSSDVTPAEAAYHHLDKNTASNWLWFGGVPFATVILQEHRPCPEWPLGSSCFSAQSDGRRQENRICLRHLWPSEREGCSRHLRLSCISITHSSCIPTTPALAKQSIGMRVTRSRLNLPIGSFLARAATTTLEMLFVGL